MDDDYMTRLSEATGLRRHQPREYKVEMIGDAVVGVKDGYIVAAGQSDENEMRIFVRFQPGVDESAFESAIKNISVESGRDLDLEFGIPDMDDETAQPTDSVSVIWRYHLNPPKPKRLAELLAIILEDIRRLARPLERRCEICRSSRVSGLTLRNGTPRYYCSNCQESEIQRLNKDVLEYERQPLEPANYLKGFVYGLTAALLTSLVASYGGSFLKGGWLGIASFVGTGALIYPVYYAITKSVGRIDDKVISLTLWTIVFEVILTNIGYYVFVAWRLTGLPFGGQLMRPALQILLNSPFWHFLAPFYMSFLGIFSAIQGGFRSDIPSPKVTFESLSDEAEQPNSLPEWSR